MESSTRVADVADSTTLEQPLTDEHDMERGGGGASDGAVDGEGGGAPSGEAGYTNMGAVHAEGSFASTGWLNKGSVSNLITFCVLILGVVLVEVTGSEFSKYVLSLGLFGFAGGITNWLAIKMLFDRIQVGPVSLIGSGVIPRRFKEIRRTVKDTIMVTFFDPAYLRHYLGERTKGMVESLDVEGKVIQMLNTPEIDALLAVKLSEAAATPEGAVLNMAAGFVPGGIAGLVPMIKPMLAGFASELGPLLARSFDIGSEENLVKIRIEIDKLMTEKLELLTPGVVKQLMERVIREHLGWLIVWGNVFGALIGAVSQAAGFGA